MPLRAVVNLKDGQVAGQKCPFNHDIYDVSVKLIKFGIKQFSPSPESFLEGRALKQRERVTRAEVSVS